MRRSPFSNVSSSNSAHSHESSVDHTTPVPSRAVSTAVTGRARTCRRPPRELFSSRTHSLGSRSIAFLSSFAPEAALPLPSPISQLCTRSIAFHSTALCALFPAVRVFIAHGIRTRMQHNTIQYTHADLLVNGMLWRIVWYAAAVLRPGPRAFNLPRSCPNFFSQRPVS